MTPLEYRRIMDSKENEKKKELSITVAKKMVEGHISFLRTIFLG
jgi:hypothetical protein